MERIRDGPKQNQTNEMTKNEGFFADGEMEQYTF